MPKPDPDPHATRMPSDKSLEEYRRHEDQATGRRGDTLPADSTAPEPTQRTRATLDQVERAVIDLGLVTADGLREILAKLPPEDQPKDAEGLARLLLRARKLTRYQASAIVQGKAKVLTIGPYLVLDRLGSGGMGMVFKARRHDREEVVALKLLPPSASKNSQSVQRFRREADVLARLDHPNVVASRDIGEARGVHYLVMDYVEGRDLDRLVRDGAQISVGRAIDMILQAARGLAEAHARGIVHRDIKPANLMLDPQGIVRVLDLGLARITKDKDPFRMSGKGSTDPSLTQSGIIMGTVDFLPPEQSNDSKRADHRSDIYSLGCTLHFLLTGKPPFRGDTIMERLIAHHQKPVPSLREARPEVPFALDAAFRRMMAKEPAARFQSMTEVIAALEICRDVKALRVFDDDPKPLTTLREPTEPITGDSDLSSYEISPLPRSEFWSPLGTPSDEDLFPPEPAGRSEWAVWRFRTVVAAVLVGLSVVVLVAITTRSAYLRTHEPPPESPAVTDPGPR